MEKTYTAYLGELGEAGPDGFGASQAETRPIVIRDDSGEIVYSKRSGDSAKAVENHIAAAGYSRNGEWADGKVAVIPRKLNGLRNAIPGVIGVGIVVAVMAGCTAINSWIDDADAPSYEADETEARVMCEEFVSERLKSPSSAKFSNQTETGSGMSWTARGTVDADNSFGASLRGTYTCRLTYDPLDGGWTSQTTID